MLVANDAQNGVSQTTTPEIVEHIILNALHKTIDTTIQAILIA
jgi:hypothetical protein